MIVDDLLRILADRDVELYLDGDRLRFRAPAGALTPSFAATLRHRRWPSSSNCGWRRRLATAAGRCAICDWRNWRDAPPRDGRVRTTCGKCGRFIRTGQAICRCDCVIHEQ